MGSMIRDVERTHHAATVALALDHVRTTVSGYALSVLYFLIFCAVWTAVFFFALR